MILDIKMALRYLSGRKTRTALTTLAIVFGVMVIFGLNGIIPTMQEAFFHGMQSAGDGVDMAISSSSRNMMDISDMAKVEAVNGVARTTGILEKGILLPEEYSLKDHDGKMINTITVVGVDYNKYNEIHKLEIIKGTDLAAENPDGILISDTLAEKTGLELGQTINMPASYGLAKFKVTGFYRNKGISGTENIILSLAAAQKLFNQPDRISSVEVVLSGTDKEAIKSNIMAELGSAYSNQTSGSAGELYTAVNLGQTIFAAFGYISILMGGFIILVSFRAVAVERRRDIGLLRAIGCTKKRILRIILTEGALQGITGTVIGILGGYILAWIFMSAVRGIMEEMMKTPIGNPSFSAATWLISIILGIGITIAGGLLPALSASRVMPLEALRAAKGSGGSKHSYLRGMIGLAISILALLSIFAGNIGVESAGWLFFMVGLLVAGPFLVKPLSELTGKLIGLVYLKEGEMARGNIKNLPERSASTTFTVTIALALLISLAGFSISAVNAMSSYIEKSLGSDFILMPQSILLGGGNMGSGPELTDSIEEIKGVSGATGISRATSKAGGNDIQVIGIDPQKYPAISGLIFSSGDPGESYQKLVRGRYLITNGILSATMGLKQGEKVTLETLEGPQQYEVVATGLDFLNAKLATVYISKENAEKDFHEKDDVLIMVNTEKSADQAAVEKALKEKVENYPAFTLYSASEMKKTLMDSVNASMSIIILLLVVMIIPSLIALINTLGIGVLERTREIGVMRAVGALRRQVKRIITAESLILASLGTVLGIVSGIWLGRILVIASNSGGFKFDYFFPLSGIAGALLTGIALGILGAQLPAKRAAHLDVVKALSYE